jgi:alpha-galactosidase
MLAAQPPMGWNSWNRFLNSNLRADIAATTEKEILAQAKAMVDSGLAAAGYEYIVLDDCYQAKRRDHLGRIQTHPHRFPSGIKGLVDQIHGLGLKFGLYSVPGTLTCAQQYDDYNGDDLGSLNRELIDAESFVEWGVDYLKYDWCRAHLNDGLIAEPTFRKMAEALKTANADIVYSISEYGLFEPHKWAPEFCNMWRTTDDLMPNWPSLLRTIDLQRELYPYSKPGAWNDPDMLQIGNGELSMAENRAHMYVWAVLNAPLMAGNDLTRMSDEVRDLLAHPGIIAVDQDWGGQQGKVTFADGDLEIWSKPMSQESGFKTASVLLNRGETTGKFDLNRIFETSTELQDVWSGDSVAKGAIDLAAHDALLLLSR